MNQLISMLLTLATCTSILAGGTGDLMTRPAGETDARSSAVVAEVTEPAVVAAAPVEGEVVDLTEKLNALIRKNEVVLRDYLAEHGHFAASLYYYVKVTDGGEWDIKVTDEWAFEKGKTYVYEGQVLRMDDPGNIHFGYLGAILFPEEFVCFGAGMNNFLKFGTVDGNLASYYDDPQDQEMMRWGYRMCKERTLW